MLSCSLEEFHGATDCLEHDFLGIGGLEAHLHTAFDGGTDIAHGISDTTAGKRCARCEKAFLGDDAAAKLVEDSLYGCRLTVGGTHGNNECHRLLLGNGDIRDDEEEREHARTVVEPSADLFRFHSCRHDDKHLLFIVEHRLNFLYNPLHYPWFHDHGHNVGALSRNGVVGGHTRSLFSITDEFSLGGIGDGDVAGKNCITLQQTLDERTAHGPCSYY